MLLGFKKRFSPYILDGSKRHTIRGRDPRKPHPGELAHCFEALRTRHTKLLGRFPMVKIVPIQLRLPESMEAEAWRGPLIILLGDQQLVRDEVNAFAWSDGFREGLPTRSGFEMAGFWREEHGLRLGDVWRGSVTYWDFDREVTEEEWKKTKRKD